MPTLHLPRDKRDRSVRAQRYDQYNAKGKLQVPSVCRECQAVYHKGWLERGVIWLVPFQLETDEWLFTAEQHEQS